MTQSKVTAPSTASAAQTKPAGDDGKFEPKAWWQWVLVYPTLVLGVLGSVPTLKELVRAARVDVPFGESTAAIQQQDLWAKNMSCMEAPFDGLKNEFDVQVDATICRSGDVLVRFIGPQDKKSYRWVPVERFEPKVAGMSLISQAHARSLLGALSGTETVVCQWAPQPGIVVRRMKDASTQQCVDEQVKTSTGQVIARTPVSCAAACGR